MKKANSIIIATIIAAFGITMFAFQPTATEASNDVSPSATPSPRKIRKIPAPTPSPITKIKAKKPKSFSFGASNGCSSCRKPSRKRSTQKRQHLPCKAGDCK